MAFARFVRHPFWLAGFRPFFALACLSGGLLPLAWVLIHSGLLPTPVDRFTTNQWHAHEMFFGFGWAVLGGFLLTATKNWVKVRGYHGGALIVLVVLWLVERAALLGADHLPEPLFRVAANAFLAAIIVMLLWTLLRHRASDSFADNVLFVVLLPQFLIAKNLLLSGDDFQTGVALTVALFRLAFLVMLERTLSQFMRSTFSVEIPRHAHLDGAIKLLALLLVATPLLPPGPAAGLEAVLAALLGFRLALWQPRLALGRIELAIMIVGYASIIAQLVLSAIERFAVPGWIGTVPVHLFTMGVMGLIIPAMIIRICKGHTGRPVAFDAVDKAVLRLMLLAFLLRVLAPQFAPGAYLGWMAAAAACWLACYAVIAVRYIPFLTAPRVDGKEH